MNRENVQKWIAALRSGKYPQGKNCLHEGEYFCALGVACDLYKPDWETITNSEMYLYQGFAIQNIPHDCREHYGLEPYMANRIADMNDGGQTFNQIADYLETQLNDNA